VEGPNSAAPFHNTDHHALQISKHLARRNSHRLESQLKQPPIALFVAFGPVTTIMRLAVNLDGFRDPRRLRVTSAKMPYQRDRAGYRDGRNE